MLDGQRRILDVNLLDDAGEVTVAAELASAVGTGIQGVLDEVGNLFGGDGLAVRSCRGWPGCPPMRRRGWPGAGAGLVGLTMSEEGGLDEVDESLRAAASCSWRREKAACNASICRR